MPSQYAPFLSGYSVEGPVNKKNARATIASAIVEHASVLLYSHGRGRSGEASSYLVLELVELIVHVV